MSKIYAKNLKTTLPDDFFYFLENYGYTATANYYGDYITKYIKNKFLPRNEVKELETELKEFFETEKLIFCDIKSFSDNDIDRSFWDFKFDYFNFDDATNTVSATYVWSTTNFLEFSKKLGNGSPNLDVLGPAAFAMPSDFNTVAKEFAKLIKTSDKNAKKPEIAQLILDNLDEFNGINSNITGIEKLDQLLIIMTNTQFGVACVKSFFTNVLAKKLSTKYFNDVFDIYLNNIKEFSNKYYTFETNNVL